MARTQHSDKKYFDEQFKRLATKAQLDRVQLSFDRRLSDQARRLEDYVGQNLEALEEDLNAKLGLVPGALQATMNELLLH